MICQLSTAADDPDSVLICDECDGDVHFGCTGLAAFPGDEGLERRHAHGLRRADAMRARHDLCGNQSFTERSC